MTCEITTGPKKGYRPCVGIMLLNESRQAFVGRRVDARQRGWQMPQGGVDTGEAAEVAARREMFEEIGTANAVLLRESAVWRSYDFPPEIAGRAWKGAYPGQTQKWLAFGFQGKDGEIDLRTPHPEFSAWRWAAPDELVDLIVAFKRDVYLSVVDEFRPLWA